jgi:large exoprotein involved in heme utilization and adhesion
LTVTGGATISASTAGGSDAGVIAITAPESILVEGIAEFTAVGQANSPSRIEVFSDRLSTGDAGALTLTTANLTLQNNGQLRSNTLGLGNAGTIKLNVSDTVLVDGGPLAPIPPGQEGILELEGTGIFSSTAPGSTGQGGNIIIDPQLVLVQNGGQISVASFGTGNAGNMIIFANQLRLDEGEILGEARSGDGGNLTFTLGELLVLENGSLISATAGTADAPGDGGNLTIDSLYVVAVPDDNNERPTPSLGLAGPC